jgi:hypothetical protein
MNKNIENMYTTKAAKNIKKFLDFKRVKEQDTPLVEAQCTQEINKKMETQIKKHLNLLGLKVKDKVTGFTGIVTSVSFDLYGCIQAIVNPGMDEDGKQKDSHYFDINRLEVKSNKPVMNVPNFDHGAIANGEKGPAEKPRFIKN